jgi:hypothetical protein
MPSPIGNAKAHGCWLTSKGVVMCVPAGASNCRGVGGRGLWRGSASSMLTSSPTSVGTWLAWPTSSSNLGAAVLMLGLSPPGVGPILAALPPRFPSVGASLPCKPMSAARAASSAGPSLARGAAAPGGRRTGRLQSSSAAPLVALVAQSTKPSASSAPGSSAPGWYAMRDRVPSGRLLGGPSRCSLCASYSARSNARNCRAAATWACSQDH